MTVAAVLQFLSSELARHGAEIISAVDLVALSAVESRLSDVRLVDADTARAVAWVASLTPSADRDAFQSAFGENAAALLDALVPSPALGPVPSQIARNLGRLALRTGWARVAAGDDHNHRTIATALLAGEAEKVLVPEDRDQLREIVDIAAKKVRDAATGRALTEISDRLVPSAEEKNDTNASSARPLLISLSIDVVGSTEAKRRLHDLAADEARRTKLYKAFYADFLEGEHRFYADLFAPGIWGHGPPLDWRRLFVVKGIGDELWLTYDASPANGEDAGAALVQAAVRLISASLSLCQRTVSCGGTGEDLGPGFDPKAEEKQCNDWMELPFKVSMDLVEDAVEISGQRLDFLTEQAGVYMAPPRDAADLRNPPPFGASHVEILRRLNAGHLELTGGHRLRQAYRTDYIGPDVDRFFRITKFALPGLVMVGDDLFKRLRIEVQDHITPEIEQILLLFPSDLHRPDSSVVTSEPVLCRRRPIAQTEMKGIDVDYAVHHLIAVPALRRLLEDATRNPFLKPTATELPGNMRELIRPKPSSGQPSGENNLAADRPPT